MTEELFSKGEKVELFESPFVCERADSGGMRYYAPIVDPDNPIPWEERAWKPSVTTVLDGGMPKGIGMMIAAAGYPSWELCRKDWDALALDGTCVHALCQELLLYGSCSFALPFIDEKTGESLEIGKRHIKRVMGFKNWYNMYKPEVLAVEIMLYHPDIPFAGTADLVVRIDGKIWLIDIKTGNEYPESVLRQLTGYKTLWDYTFDESIDIISPMMLPKDYRKEAGSFKVYPQKYKYSPELLENTYQQWFDLHGSNAVREPIELPITITLQEEEEDEIITKD